MSGPGLFGMQRLPISAERRQTVRGTIAVFSTEAVTNIALAFPKRGIRFRKIRVGPGGLTKRFVTNLKATISSNVTTSPLKTRRAVSPRKTSKIAETTLTTYLLTKNGSLNNNPSVTVLLTILVRLAVTVTILVRTKNTN